MSVNLGLRAKFFFLITGVIVLMGGTLTILVSNRAYDTAKEDAFILAQETAEKYQNEIRAELQGARITAETLASVFGTLKDIGKSDRATLDSILQNALANKEYITAFCVTYELNAVDGKDAELAKAEEEKWKEAEKKAEEAKKNGKADAKPEDYFTKRWDSSGRYAPYWNKLGGNIAVEPLLDKDICIADWWIVPQETKAEYITNPYPYLVQGKEVMLESLIFPVIHNGNFIGIVSSDIVLNKLQEMVTKINPNTKGGYTEIFSNNAAIAAHPDKRLLGRDISEVILYELITRKRDAVPAVISLAEKYLADNPVKDANNEEEKGTFDKLNGFVQQLKEYKDNSDVQKLDFSLLTAEFAEAVLKADAERTSYAADVREAIKNGKEYIFHEAYYTIYVPIRFSEATTPWSVAVSIPMANVLKSAKTTRNYVISVCLIFAGLIAVSVYIVTGKITKPILLLAKSAEYIGHGNFNAEIPQFRQKDEIGTLSHAFQSMVGELQHRAEELVEKNVYLNHLNEIKDEFLANTSHELCTPINGIIGIVESMLDGAVGQLSDEQKYNLAVVANSGKRLSHLVNDILDFTKLKNREIELQLKTIDLKTITDMVIVLSKPLIKGKDLILVNEIETSIPFIKADENRIQQILYNLIGNAIKFTEKGKITVSAEVQGTKVAVQVQDTGIGIAQRNFDKIFESFEQADGSTAREYGGTGLGLSITKKIVELQGGHISVESEVGNGSAFTFTIPVSTEQDSKEAEAAKSKIIVDIEKYIAAETKTPKQDISAKISDGKPKYRILIVDDESVNIQVLFNLLSKYNFSLEKAFNGQEVLALFEKGEQFDLVLLDVMMPKLTGYDVCKRLRMTHSLADLPIIMMTAKNQIRDIVLGFQSGANDYIFKPFEKDELIARINTLLELKTATTAADIAAKAKTLFLANMSHELRTPLNAVIGLTELLRNTQMNETQQDYTEKMCQAASVLLGLIENVLDFSKIETGKLHLARSEFSIRRMFDNLKDLFTYQNSDSPVEMRMDADKDIPETLLSDPERLQQIFINLISNAYKFSEKGTITVKAELVRRDPGTVLLQFSVSDTGIGMSPEQLQKIFAVFEQADTTYTRKYGGAGIGLTLTRELIELFGGDITVKSKENEGTVFSFSISFQIPENSGIPLSDTNEIKKLAEAVPETSDSNNMLKGMKVLLVEDNTVNAMITAELLKQVGVEVTTAANGRLALDKLQEAHAAKPEYKPFDLILMDLQMPVMDGYEATKIIKETPEYKDIPIYALTAHAFVEERQHCFALGMEEHLTKPIDMNNFYKALRKAAKHT
ncbi:hypothetical protein FACS189427_06080 [Planctomycetales bacterium]|nr:hypothetical protein FACS189427_06080 [Planctomycetales bacterium]